VKVALTVINGPERGRVIDCTAPRGFLIGRARDADIRIPDDPYMSRRHVYLEICPPHCRLRDIGSTNAPCVNGEPVAERDLADGDIVELGYTQVRVSISTEAAVEAARCGGCGARIDLVAGEAPPVRCPTCAPERRKAAARPAPDARCAYCGIDLGARADADRRAAELAAVAHYACERHLERDARCNGLAVGDYALLRLLGEGAMGAVYLAYHRPTARVWALKRIKDLDNDVLVKRFEREVQLTQDVVHPAIVRCVDTGIDREGLPYLVSEYMPDGSVEDAVQRAGGRLPVPEAVRLVAGVLEGIEYLHARGIIHRDVKPGNILLRGRGAASTPKLTDLGIAKSYARAGGTWRTRAGTRLGTLMFMPPEQVKDAGRVGAPADIYAAGVTLYYLLTGRYSFNFPSPVEAAAFQREQRGMWEDVDAALQALLRYRRVKHPFFIILEEEPVPIRERDPSIPRALAEVVDQAVRKDPGARFRSAAEFRRALEDRL
jgi:serine/threonine-protein kinase